MYANRDSPVSAGAQNSSFLGFANSVTIAMSTLAVAMEQPLNPQPQTLNPKPTRTVFLKSSNHIDGAYFGELAKARDFGLRSFWGFGFWGFRVKG